MGRNAHWLVLGGLLVLVVALGLWFWPRSPTGPTEATTSSGRLEIIGLPESIWAVIDKPTGTGLAADDYNKGVVEYYDSDRYKALRNLTPERRREIGYGKFPYRVYKYVTAGAKKRRMGYFENYVKPTEAVGPSHQDLIAQAELAKPPLPHLHAFKDMAEATLLYGEICEKGNQAKEAERLYKAVLVFGYHVAEDRVRLFSFQTGLNIQIQAAQHLVKLYQDRKQADALAKASALLKELTEVFDGVARKAKETLFRTDGDGHLHPGDLLNIAASDADPMWRIEAVRQLGLCRAALNQGGNRADYKAITELLTRFEQASDGPGKDPFIEAAANLGLAMTMKDVRGAT
ncbi:MAG: hypothetical protein JXQ73_10405 [Phycisphaerae bacterium]|nr:hypothetical protein [Phycisphaerae bacterium]